MKLKDDRLKTCRYCKGTGIDKNLQFRYTTGGHDDRSCEHCNGDGVIDNGQVEQLAGSPDCKSGPFGACGFESHPVH